MESNHKPTRIHLARNWWTAYLSFPLFIGGMLFVIWTKTWPAIKAAESGQALPDGSTWLQILTLDLICLLLALLWCIGVLAQLLTVFTDEGIWRPKLFGSTFIRWPDVTSVKGWNRQVLELESRGQKIKINKIYYKEIDKLTSLVQEHLSSGTRGLSSS